MLKLARVFVLVSIPVLLIASPLYVLVTNAYVRRAYARPDFPPSSRYTPAERQRLSDTLVGYLRGRATREDMAALRTEAGLPAMTPEEVEHMADVKGVMDGFFIAHAIALALGLAATVGLVPRQPVRWALAVRQGILVTAALIAVVAIAAVADFDLFFTLFHRIFFQEGTWTFPYEDTLIQLYPLPFWTRAVADISLMVAGGAALLYAVSRWVEARALRRSAP